MIPFSLAMALSTVLSAFSAGETFDRRIGTNRIALGAATPRPWSIKDPPGFKLVTDGPFFHWERPWYRRTAEGEKEFGGILEINAWEGSHVCYDRHVRTGKTITGVQSGHATYRGRCAIPSPAIDRNASRTFRYPAEFFVFDYQDVRKAPFGTASMANRTECTSSCIFYSTRRRHVGPA